MDHSKAGLFRARSLRPCDGIPGVWLVASACKWPPARAATSFSQGARWNALISAYIAAIPLSGDPCPAAQSIAWLPATPVTSAMIAKVGAAASDNQLATRIAPALPIVIVPRSLLHSLSDGQGLRRARSPRLQPTRPRQ